MPPADRLTLALETSGRSGSVALVRGEEILGSRALDRTQRSGQSLAPALQQLLDEVGCPPSAVGLVAVTVGPGSFTGLRVGVTTAKVFAYAVAAAVIGVDTLAVIADRAPREVERLEVVLDAQRHQIFTARFERDAEGNLTPTRATAIEDLDTWLARLDSGTHVSGPMLKTLASKLPPAVQAVPAERWQPTAEGVARRGLAIARTGHRDDVWQLAPRYYRASAAEEQWAARESPP